MWPFKKGSGGNPQQAPPKPGAAKPPDESSKQKPVPGPGSMDASATKGPGKGAKPPKGKSPDDNIADFLETLPDPDDDDAPVSKPAVKATFTAEGVLKTMQYFAKHGAFAQAELAKCNGDPGPALVKIVEHCEGSDSRNQVVAPTTLATVMRAIMAKASSYEEAAPRIAEFLNTQTLVPPEQLKEASRFGFGSCDWIRPDSAGVTAALVPGKPSGGAAATAAAATSGSKSTGSAVAVAEKDPDDIELADQ